LTAGSVLPLCAEHGVTFITVNQRPIDLVLDLLNLSVKSIAFCDSICDLELFSLLTYITCIL